MQVFHEAEPLRRFIAAGRDAGRRVAFVPTMGALHDGHRACVDLAGREADAFVVCSIFVNPTQFGPGEDLGRYPRTLASDLDKLSSWACDAAFVPGTDAVYAQAQRVWVVAEGMTDVMCGRFRPGHFRGVLTVVAKLVNIVGPDVVVFGQKDAQQALLVRDMIAQLNLPLDIRLARTVRESDGLAMSSRNAYLAPPERAQAAALHRSLVRAGDRIAAGMRDPRALERSVVEDLGGAGVERIDYVEARSAHDLSALAEIGGRVILAAAVWIGSTRLIDNMVFDVRGSSVERDAPLF